MLFFVCVALSTAGQVVRRAKPDRLGAETIASGHHLVRRSFSQLQGLPAELDWSKTDKLPPPPDQGGFCNSCYIWAALAVAEGRHAIAHNVPAVAQSGQEVVDCARQQWMNGPTNGVEKTWKKWGIVSRGKAKGCQTGEPAQILQFVLDIGVQAADEYPIPYERKATYERDRSWDVSNCQATGPSLFRPPAGSRLRKARNSGDYRAWEAQVLAALQSGPVAVSIDKSSHAVFQAGKNFAKDCRTKEPSHAVAIVGYGSGPQPYWVVRNSWGPHWGEEGHMLLPRGKNICGVEQTAWWIEYPA